MNGGTLKDRAEALFLEIAAEDSSKWESLLTERCGADAELREEVGSLLGFHHKAGSFMDHQELLALTPDLVRLPDLALPKGMRFGEYTIERVLGSGGMGIVYVARQERPRRTVALKLVNQSIASPALLRRFEHEAEVLGRLQHPGIAQIFEAGAAEASPGAPKRPFISMELVDGPPLIEYAKLKGLDTRGRLQLMIKVCEAVQHAHQRGVIHRDLKPANILVDPNGQPKVLDFGVARVTGADLAVTTMQTSLGQLIGTLPYMSPEQVLGDPSEIDTRSDVYALGVVLYELLSGRHPLDLGSRSIPDAVRVIRNEDPRRLSSISKVYRGDIETIVSKALEKEKERRYQSAAELAHDLESHLRGEPISAKTDSALYVLRKQIRRHRWAVGAAALVAMGIVAFAIFAGVQARVQARLASNERVARLEAVTARDEATRKAEELRRNLYVSAIGFAEAARASNDIERVRRLLESCPVDLRGWEWRFLRSVIDSSSRVVTPPQNPDAIVCASRDGSKLLSWLGYEPIVVLDGATGAKLKQYDPRPQQVSHAQLSADGRFAVAGSFEGFAVRIDLETDTIVRQRIIESGVIFPMYLWNDGERLLYISVSSNGERAVRIWRFDEGRDVAEFECRQTIRADVNERDGLVALINIDGLATVHSIEGGPPIRSNQSHRKMGRDIAFGPDGTLVASAGNDGVLTVWDYEGGTSISHRLFTNKAAVLRWNPNGGSIAVAGTEAVIKIVNAQNGDLESMLLGHETTIERLEWPGGKDILISWSRDRTIRWWDRPAESRQPFRDVKQMIMAAAWTPDGSRFYIGVENGDLLRIDAATLRTEAVIGNVGSNVNELTLSADGTMLAASGDGGLVQILDLSSGGVISSFRAMSGRSLDVAFDPSGERIAHGSDDAQVTILDVRTGEVILRLPAFGVAGIRVAWGIDGSTLFVAYDHRIVEHDSRSGEVIRTFEAGGPWLSQLRISKSGQYLIATSEDGKLYMWDLSSGEPPKLFSGHKRGVYSVSLSPDDSRLVTGGWDNTVRIWDVSTGLELLMLRPHIGAVWVTEFSPDGSTILSASTDGTMTLLSDQPFQGGGGVGLSAPTDSPSRSR